MVTTVAWSRKHSTQQVTMRADRERKPMLAVLLSLCALEFLRMHAQSLLLTLIPTLQNLVRCGSKEFTYLKTPPFSVDSPPFPCR